MTLKPHSKAWYAKLAAETGGYTYPWTQVLNAPGGEALFDALLEYLLTPELNVLEAGCGHGLDAQRYAPRVQSYTGYDFTPVYVERARQNAPRAEFVVWDSSREPVPEFGRRFDLVMSRRGPTSVIPHLLTAQVMHSWCACSLYSPGRRRSTRQGASSPNRLGTGRTVACLRQRFSSGSGGFYHLPAFSRRRAHFRGAL